MSQIGVTQAEIEALFLSGSAVFPDIAHSAHEERFIGIGRLHTGRYIFVAFTFRVIDGEKHIRPISARYMHDKEIAYYEEKNSPFRQ